MMERLTLSLLVTRRKTAKWLRRLADWIHTDDPVVQYMPRTRQIILDTEHQAQAGSIKWLLALKRLEKEFPDARRRFLNAAIDRAVLERDGY